MSEQYIETVADTFTQVLENVAMFFGDRAEADEVAPPEGENVAVSLTFSGAGEGMLRLMTTAEAAAEVAANVLGLDADDDEAREAAMDALMELVNVTMGQILPELAGNTAVFDLSQPQLTSDVSDEDWHEFLEQANTIAFTADDYPMLLSFEVSANTNLESAGE